MGLIHKIKKIYFLTIVLSTITGTMSGCVYANNKNWNDMTLQEKQEVKEQFREEKERLEQENADDGFEDKLGSFILDAIEEEFDNLE